MSINEAKETLSGASSVQEWNMIRDEIKPELTVSELAQIDGNGFIKTVKAKNGWYQE